MFIGHFAIGFAAKRVAPRASLASLLAAPLLADLLWPIFLLLGLEHAQINSQEPNPFLKLTFTDYPWSHSLVLGLVWGVVFGGAYYLITRYRTGAWVIGLAVVSHWVLDVATHRPDLPLSPWGGPRLGLGLWHSVAGTVIVETGMFVLGVWIYARATAARDRIGRYGWWGLVALTGVAYLGNLSGSTPPSVAALAWTAVIASLATVVWAWWVDRHRTASFGE